MYVDDKGSERVDTGAIQNKRVKIDAYKWRISKLNPKKYGDKLHLDHSSEDGSINQSAIDLSKLSPETLAKVIKEIEASKQEEGEEEAKE